MTTTSSRSPAAPARPAAPRSDAELLADQLAAMTLWEERRRQQSRAATGPQSREMRLDLNRREEVERRQQAALEARCEELLRAESPVVGRPRAVLVHRNAWLRDKVRDGLAQVDVEVVAGLDNGADALGYAIAEQPDLVLLEGSLPMVSGLELVAALRRYCPRTLLVAHVAHDEEVRVFLDAGVRAAWTRRVPPADIVGDLAELLTQR
jgi:CheY-like chemotaxis protein